MECVDLKNFSQTARDHATAPRCYGPLQTCNGHARITGDCGDTMEFWVVITDGVIEKVSFTTDGCGSSRACGSMTVTLAKGMRMVDAMSLTEQEILEALGHFPRESAHCARLSATTLTSACENFLRTPAEKRPVKFWKKLVSGVFQKSGER